MNTPVIRLYTMAPSINVNSNIISFLKINPSDITNMLNPQAITFPVIQQIALLKNFLKNAYWIDPMTNPYKAEIRAWWYGISSIKLNSPLLRP